MYYISMNETNKLNKIKEARELGLRLLPFMLGNDNTVNGVTEFHIMKTMNQSTWIGSMKCGKRVGLENSLDYYDMVINNSTYSWGDIGGEEVRVIDQVCTDCLEKI